MRNKQTLFAVAVILLLTLGLWLIGTKNEKPPAKQAKRAETRLAPFQPTLLRNPVSNQRANLRQSPLATKALRKTASAWNSTSMEPTTARFAEWFSRFDAATAEENRALIAQGQSLASERRTVLKELIRDDPERALENAVPYFVRKRLPDSIRSLLEERVSGRGELAVFGALAEPGKENKVEPIFRTATIGSRTFKAFAYGRRLEEPTLRDVPFNGIAVDNFLALNENPVRILEPAEAEEISKPEEAICSVSGDPADVNEEETLADVGGEIVFLCKIAHADFLNSSIIAAADVAASTSTEGEKKLILIRVDFPDKPGNPFSNTTGTNLVSGLNSFYLESSYNRTGFALVGQGSDYTPTFRMPHNSAYYGTNDYFVQLRADARAAASAYGYVLSDYDYDLICMTNVTGFNWAGLGYVGAAGAWIRNSFGTGVSAHELGHNYGLNHANFWDTGGASIIGSPGTNVEYGDIFDTMGSATAGNNHFNVRNKRLLNWVRADEIAIVTNSGTYRIFAQDNPATTGLRGLSIAKNGTTNYWVEFRQKFTSNKWLMNGVGLRWAPTGNKQSMLLDTTPGSSSGKTDSAIVIGRTFSDKYSGIHITPIRKGGTSPESVDVVVNRGTFSGNVAPTLVIAASATNANSGTLVNFTATAHDANGDALAYYWDFGDGNFGTNGPAASKSWTSTREYVVRCTVSDMKGGVASDSVIIRVGFPVTYRISGTVKNGTQPVEGVRVFVSNSQMTYTDSDGTYNLVGLLGKSYTVEAQLDGYTFYQIFSNPVTVGPSATDIDFNTEPVAPPTIVSQPQDVFVAAGANATFQVEAQGDSLFYQWRFNGAPLLDRTNNTLTLTNVQLSNAGNYSVVVSNVGNSAISSNAALVVNVPPNVSSIPDQTISEGEHLTFAVSASDMANNVTNTFADFENYPNGAAAVMFRAPNYSPSTGANLDGSPNVLVVSTNPPVGLPGNRAALNASWSFKSGVSNSWLHLTTYAANSLPNPTVNFSHHLRLSIYSDRALQVAAGLRETGTAAEVGADGGSSGAIEFIGVSDVINGTPIPVRTIAANVWTTLDFDLSLEPAASFNGGNGILESASNKGVLESLCFVPGEGSGVYNVFVDNFADVNVSRLTYALEPDAPEGATIDPQTGIFSWTPGEQQGPGNYTIAVRVTDDGIPALSRTNQFVVNVLESNLAPVLAAVTNRFIQAGETLVVTNTATDADWPANGLSFHLATNAPIDATINSLSGVLEWTAPFSENFVTNTFGVVVTDDGEPALSDEKSFQVVVVPPLRATAQFSSDDGEIVFSWPGFPGKRYQVQYKENLSDSVWLDFGNPITANGGIFSITNAASISQQKFFRVVETQ